LIDLSFQQSYQFVKAHWAGSCKFSPQISFISILRIQYLQKIKLKSLKSKW